MSCATPSSSPPTTPISTSRMIFALAARSSSSAAMSRFSLSSTADPSHMCDWNSGFPPVPHGRLEQRLLPAVHPLLADGDQRPDVDVQLVLRAVVGVQRHVDRVLG